MAAGTSGEYVAQGVSITSGSVYAQDWYVAPGSGITYVQLPFNVSAFSGNLYADFNIQSCTVTATSAGVTARAVVLANGWCWVSDTATATATGSQPAAYLWPVQSGTAGFAPSATWAGTEYLYAWNADFTQASVATSPIVTTSASATRAADAVYITLPANLLPTNGYTLRAKGIFGPSTGSTRIFAEGGLTSLAGATIGTDSAGTGVRVLARSGNARGDTATMGGALGASSVFNAAVSGGPSFVAALNGTRYSSGATPGQSSWAGGLSLGARTQQGGGNAYSNTYLQAIELDGYAATPAQAQSKTLH
jgi:hypothetical protein